MQSTKMDALRISSNDLKIVTPEIPVKIAYKNLVITFWLPRQCIPVHIKVHLYVKMVL